MSRDSASKIHIKAFDDLFGGGESDNTNSEELLKDAVEIPLDELHPFKNHPFTVRHDDKLQEMVESIKKVGVLNPGIARKDPNGGYELISGHTRKEASKRAGLTTMPILVRDYDDDLATIAMVDSNLQREEILVSEKVRAYAMKYEAMKHQGNGNGVSSLEVMSEELGEGYKTIQRLIKLDRLSDNLLKMIDDKKLGMTQGLDLTELNDEQQKMVFEQLTDTGTKLSMKQSGMIKALAQADRINEKNISDVIAGASSDFKPKATDTKAPTSDKKIEKTIYEHFLNAGYLSYNEENDRYGVKKDDKWFVEGLHCGDCLNAFIDGKWVTTSIESDASGNWHLSDTRCAGILENIIVKIEG